MIIIFNSKRPMHYLMIKPKDFTLRSGFDFINYQQFIKLLSIGLVLTKDLQDHYF